MMRSLLFALALTTLVALPLHAETRTWTSADGSRTVEAEFVGVSDGKVTLKRTDGRTVAVPVDSLSAADQEFIKNQANSPEPAQAPGDNQGVRVEVLGLSIGKPTPKIPEDDENANFAMMLFGAREGTQVRVWMYAPERTLLGIDEEASKVTAFTDDKATDLTKSPERPAANNPLAALMGGGSNSPFGVMVSQHKRSCVVTIQGGGIPAAGAEKITVDATITLKCGIKPATADAPAVKLEEGLELVTGPMTWTVDFWDTDIGMPGANQVISISTEQSVALLDSIECLDEAGKPIPTRLLETMAMTPEEGGEYTVGIPENREVVGLRVTYFGDVETVKVPVKVTTGVGW